jgi:hypothetical protein
MIKINATKKGLPQKRGSPCESIIKIGKDTNIGLKSNLLL